MSLRLLSPSRTIVSPEVNTLAMDGSVQFSQSTSLQVWDPAYGQRLAFVWQDSGVFKLHLFTGPVFIILDSVRFSPLFING